MVDVSDKADTDREALAEAVVTMNAAARRAIRRRDVKKGDPLQTARLAGILAAKRTADLIPLCHPLQLSHVDVLLRPTPRGYILRARVRTSGRTGVEMEALVAVSAALLTLNDMAKAIDRGMTIAGVRLLRKSGGRSGLYARPGGRVTGVRRRR
jgi:cyclic pyranopterin phosphate synthase